MSGSGPGREAGAPKTSGAGGTNEAIVRVAAAVVWRDDRILLTQRPPDRAHPLMWEFPGGKIEAGESAEQALIREIDEELGVRAVPLERLHTERHAYPGGPAVEIVFVRCVLETHELLTREGVHAVRWVRPAEIDLEQVLAGDHDLLVRFGARRRQIEARTPTDQRG